MSFINFSELLKNEDLNPVHRVLGIIGKVSFVVASLGVGIISLNGGVVDDSIWNEIGSKFFVTGVIIGSICSLVVRTSSAVKSKGLRKVTNSVTHVLKMVFLTMFLPAIIITAIFTIIIVLSKQ